MKKEDIKFAFNCDKLKKGDILLINDYEERLRERMGGAKYTHAALYMGDAFIMEANGYVWFTELFERLQTLYGDSNIQYFDKLVKAGLEKPEHDEMCIKEIESSCFFNFKERMINSYPWIESTETFAERYPKTEDRLWFLHIQELHFEKTYLPIFKQNASAFWLMSIVYPKSKLICFLSESFRSILDDAENVLNKMYQLFDFTLADAEGCRLFYQKLHEEVSKSNT